nr:hypothetical protein [Tanacetum cinerariifolium]
MLGVSARAGGAAACQGQGQGGAHALFPLLRVASRRAALLKSAGCGRHLAGLVRLRFGRNGRRRYARRRSAAPRRSHGRR